MEKPGKWISTGVSENSCFMFLSIWILFSVDRIQKESDEFISESQQLEKEYEATIDQNEKKIKELTIANTRAQDEIETLRVNCLKI